MFQLKERGYILRIFESWTSRINKSSASVKDFYNSIKVKGIELTKALIKICHYGTFVDIPKLAEGKLEREDDLKDWEELVNSYIWGCWSCISSIITYTQTKEAVYEQFLFTSNKSQLPLWDLIVPASTEYKFSVETDFKVKDCRNEIHWDNNEEDEIIKRFNDSFFANDNLLMAVPLKSQVNLNPQRLKRNFDKVRDLLDKDEEMEEEKSEQIELD